MRRQLSEVNDCDESEGRSLRDYSRSYELYLRKAFLRWLSMYLIAVIFIILDYYSYGVSR